MGFPDLNLASVHKPPRKELYRTSLKNLKDLYKELNAGIRLCL